MVKRCVVGNCNNSNLTGSTMHLFPRDRMYRQKWERFVRQGRAHWTHATATSVICGAHFVTPDDFEGYQQWIMGYKRQLDLKKGAIPSKMSHRKDPETPICTPTVSTATSTSVPTATAHSPATLSATKCLPGCVSDESGDRTKRTRTDSAVRKLSVARVRNTFFAVVLSCCSGRIKIILYHSAYTVCTRCRPIT